MNQDDYKELKRLALSLQQEQPADQDDYNELKRLALTLGQQEKHNNQSYKYGALSIALSAAVILIAAIVNLAIQQLPANFTNIDLSTQRLYTLGDTTHSVLDSLEDNVTIYLLQENTTEDTKTTTMLNRINHLLDRYLELSDHITVQHIDPVSNPTFLDQFDAQDAGNGSLVVESSKRHKVVYSDDIYITITDLSGNEIEQFDAENQLTSAIDFVTSYTLPVVYELNGHGEVSLSDTVLSQMSMENFDHRELNLMAEQEIPPDCNVLIINGPSTDFSEEEADMIIEWLQSGGKAYISVAYTDSQLPQFQRILDNYGVSIEPGIVMEGSSDSYYQSPLYLLPTINSTPITDPILKSDTLTLFVQAQGINRVNVRSTVTCTPLVTTTENAFSKLPVNGQFPSTEKEFGDGEGPFDLAVTMEETVDDTHTTQIVLISTALLTEDSVTEYYNVSNMDLFLNSINWLCQHESSISIHSKNLVSNVVAASSFYTTICGLIFVVLLPAGLLLTGLIIWLRRRKK